MAILNRFQSLIAEASRNTVSRGDSDRLTENQRDQLKVMFAKDPDRASELVWNYGQREGLAPAQIRQIIAEYKCD